MDLIVSYNMCDVKKEEIANKKCYLINTLQSAKEKWVLLSLLTYIKFIDIIIYFINIIISALWYRKYFSTKALSLGNDIKDTYFKTNLLLAS